MDFFFFLFFYIFKQNTPTHLPPEKPDECAVVTRAATIATTFAVFANTVKSIQEKGQICFEDYRKSSILEDYRH